MSDPQKPDRRLQSAEDKRQQAAVSRETSRPADSVPVVAGQFTNLPATFGRYQVEKLLGRGAMGAVYLARDTKLGRLVALKIPKVAASGSKRLLARLETEAKAAAQLDHPSLCKVHDAGEINGQCFIAMQYLDGETLKTQLEAKSKSVAEAVSLIVQLAEGLSEAHELGIIHRDLKPENIMINRKGTPVIMDFGLAKFSTISSNAVATQAGTILGSPAYMSPEQANGNTKEIDQRSDIYSLGTIFYELLTGQWPFNGSAMQILGQKTLTEPASPLTLKPDLPPQVAAICHKMVAKNSIDRYQTLADAMADLKKIDLSVAPPTSTAPVAPATGLPFAFPDFAVAETPDAQLASVAKRKTAKPSKEVRKPSTAKTTLPQKLTDWWNCQTPNVRWTTLGGAGAILIALGIMLLFPTEHGTIQINIEDPSLSARFDGNTINFDDAGHPLRVTSTAKRTLEVLQNGIAIESGTQELTIKRGDKRVVNLKLLGDDVVLDGKRIGKITTAKAGDLEQETSPITDRNEPVPSVSPPDPLVQDGTFFGKVAGEARMLAPGMQFRWCPKATFMMGSPAADVGGKGEHPEYSRQVQVSLSTGFWLGETEVTQGQWKAVMESEPWKGQGYVASDLDNAVSYIIHGDAGDGKLEADSAMLFCQRLTDREQQAGRLPSDWKYALPTEAQWEYACRAGTTTRYVFGDDPAKLSDYAWWGGLWGNGNAVTERYPHRVGLKQANAWGLRDMHGNVFEWCADWYGENFPGGVDPTGASVGSDRVYRGGCWNFDAQYCGSAYRGRDVPSTRVDYVGFRVAAVRTAQKLEQGIGPITEKNGHAPVTQVEIPDKSKKASLDDPLEVGSVWDAERAVATFTVLERKGTVIRVHYEFNRPTNKFFFVNEVQGKVIGNKVSWQGKDARIISGGRCADAIGTISERDGSYRIDFEWNDGTTTGTIAFLKKM